MTLKPVPPNDPPGTLIEGDHGWFGTPMGFFATLVGILILSGLIFIGLSLLGIQDDYILWSK